MRGNKLIKASYAFWYRPADTLAKHNIPLIKDLPSVGLNLKNHYFAVHSWRPRYGLSCYTKPFDDAKAVKQGEEQFAFDGSGPLKSLFRGISIVFHRLENIKSKISYAELPRHVQIDIDFRVHRVDGLRVMDMSVLPFLA